ncbi:zinc finger, CCHC-type containing protein [Tanacetum coccineum]|uniref:Zinc finger, CCHC-type containing protein n=1 Tax=Tanacetum coccineum TaxID=301880 RepID=A0ABQ4YKY5_9ASTR
MVIDGENRERKRLRLFQFSLRDQASNWLERLPAGSITTWEDLTTRFLAQFFPPGKTTKLRNDILMFQQHQGESLLEAWTRFKDLLRKVPHHGIDLWLLIQIFYDHVDYTTQMGIDYAAGGRLKKLRLDEAWATIEKLAQYEDEGWNDAVIPNEVSLNYENTDIEQLLRVMECKVDTLMKEAISLIGRRESIFGMTSNTVYQLPSEPSRQEKFEDLVMNFILDQEKKVRQFEEYMCVIGSDFMQLSLEVVGKLREEIRIEQNRTKKIKKITSSQQVLPSFEECTPIVTYPEEVEETLGTLIEVEPLDETQLEDLGLNTCNHDISLSSREVPSFDEPKPQPQPLHNCPSLDVNLGDERSPEPPIKPLSPDSFRMKVVDSLAIHTPPSPYVASFHPKDTYCYYRPCIDDPKKHYGFKPGLLGHSGSLSVDFSNFEMIKNDWGLESMKVSFLGRGLSLPVKPKELEKSRIKETHHLEHIIQQPIFQQVASSHNNGVYRYYHPHLNSSVGEPSPLSVK